MKIKKLLIIVVACLLVFSACGKDGNHTDDPAVSENILSDGTSDEGNTPDSTAADDKSDTTAFGGDTSFDDPIDSSASASEKTTEDSDPAVTDSGTATSADPLIIDDPIDVTVTGKEEHTKTPPETDSDKPPVTSDTKETENSTPAFETSAVPETTKQTYITLPPYYF